MRVNQLNTFANTEWQKKAQEEVDRVCGDRMPTTADAPALPIVRACLKETLRWRSGVPLGSPPCQTNCRDLI